jgi:putative ABC transport system permease protein
VESAAIVNHLPLNHETNLVPYALPGQQPDASGRQRTAIEVDVTAGYFRTMGIALRNGRDFDRRDAATALPVAVVNHTLAARLWGTDSPVGRQLEIGHPRMTVTIVGVVDSARQRELVGEPEPILYRPLTQVVRRHARLVVRTSGAPEALIDDVQTAVWRSDALLPLTEVRSLDQVVVDFLLPQRAMTISMTNMAITGLCVTAIGLYGVLAVFVAQRRREIGIRMALGATRHTVVRTIVWRSLRTTLIGLVLGLGASAFMTRSLVAVLPGATPADPLAILGTLILLATVAFAASYVPARRATKLDPLIVLRQL